MRKEMPKRRKTALRVVALVFAFLAVLALILLALEMILPGFIEVLEYGDQDQLVAYIRGFGSVGGVALAFLLQFIQIVSIFFPGGPIQVAIGVVFGTFAGFFICYSGYVLANIAVFFSARRLGNRIDQLFSNGETNPSRFRFLTDAQHPGFVVALSCLIPLLPNGLVPYIAARTKITFWQFLLAVGLGCVPTLLMLNAIGNKLLHGDYLTMALLVGALITGVALMYLFRKRIFSLADRLHAARVARKQTHTND